MKEQFVSYEIALALKELGFDEGCLAFYYGQLHTLEIGFNWLNSDCKNSLLEDIITAPLWQQVINWFLKQGLFITFKYYIPEAYSYIIFPTKERFKSISGGCFNREIHDDIDGFYKVREQAILKAIELCQKS